MMDGGGGLLNSMVGDYLHVVGSKCAQEFRELTKAAPLPPDSPGLGEMVQQISAMTEIFHQFHAVTPVKRKLEMPGEEADNPSPDKKSKKVRNCLASSLIECAETLHIVILTESPHVTKTRNEQILQSFHNLTEMQG